MHSSIEKLRKIIKLERDRGYDNRAVVGGLEKLLPSWEIEARTAQFPEDLVETISAHLRDYANIDQENRVTTIDDLLKTLDSFPDPKPVVVDPERRHVRPAHFQRHDVIIQPPQPAADVDSQPEHPQSPEPEDE